MRSVNWLSPVLSAVVLTLAGCDRTGAPKVEAGKDPVATSGHEDGKHTAHGIGPNGGVIFDLGAFHAEVLVNPDERQATVLIMTPEDNRPARIASDGLTLTTKESRTRDGKVVPRFTVQLVPQARGADGTASKFMGRDAALATVADFEGAVAGLINGKPGLGEFTLTKHGDVPVGVSGTSAERDLFLTPGGIYTTADIKANGSTVPSQKFRDVSWPHDDDLKPGDKVCPVTANKADPRCNWIVNGKKYEFCCTPCLDKFIKWAKQDPNKVKEPDSYIQK